MGTTPVPLKIVVPGDWLEEPYFKALREKGHQVEPSLDAELGADIIFHPQAHACPVGMLQKPALLDVALKRARAAKRLTQPTKSGKVRSTVPRKETK